jgi:hypothetical protein
VGFFLYMCLVPRWSVRRPVGGQARRQWGLVEGEEWRGEAKVA